MSFLEWFGLASLAYAIWRAVTLLVESWTRSARNRYDIVFTPETPWGPWQDTGEHDGYHFQTRVRPAPYDWRNEEL